MDEVRAGSPEPAAAAAVADRSLDAVRDRVDLAAAEQAVHDATRHLHDAMEALSTLGENPVPHLLEELDAVGIELPEFIKAQLG